jgi:hypothetical protein
METDLFPSQVSKERRLHLGPFDRANLALDRVQNASNSQFSNKSNISVKRVHLIRFKYPGISCISAVFALNKCLSTN